MTLTAATLNTLVNAPFTMPDGTTRRALWERVDATRPRWMRDFRDDAVFERTLAWADDGEVAGAFCAAFVVDDEVRYDPEPVYVGEAVALIRCAIYDWMAMHGTITLRRDAGIFTDRPIGKAGDYSLVETAAGNAHAMADALGTPP